MTPPGRRIMAKATSQTQTGQGTTPAPGVAETRAAIKAFHVTRRWPHRGSWLVSVATPFLPLVLILLTWSILPAPDVTPASPADAVAENTGPDADGVSTGQAAEDGEGGGDRLATGDGNPQEESADEDPPALPPGRQQFEDRATELIDRGFPTAELNELSPADIFATVDAMRGYTPPADPDPSPSPADRLDLYVIDLRFTTAAMVMVVISLTTLVAQARTIRESTRRYWNRLPEGAPAKEREQAFLRRGTRVPNELDLFLWLVVAAIVATAALQLVPDVWSWLPQPDRSDDTVAALPVLASREIAWLLAALVAGVIAVSTFGISITDRNYPPQAQAAKLKDALDEAHPKTLAAVAKAEGRATARPRITTTANIKQMVDAWPDDASLPPKGVDKVPVNHTLTPREVVAIINDLARALLLVLVVGLITLSLGLDVLEARLDLGETLSTSIAAAHDMWVIVLGVFLSLMYAAIYVTAISRLNPYVEAEDALKDTPSSKPSGWRFDLGQTGADLNKTILVPRKAESTLADFPPSLEHHLGANEKKMRIMLEATRYGGGFHLTLKEGLSGQIRTVLGFIAPAATAALLQVV
jgi:hypothetical protein